MAMTGFNPEIVNASIKNVQSAYEELMSVLGDQMQRDFVDGMQDKWACKEAQEFFTNSFKPTIESIIKSSTATFESVVTSMGSAGRAWAEDTKTSYNPPAFSADNKQIDASVIQENVGGIRGIDKDSAATVAAKLPGLATSAKDALDNAKKAVQNSGFVGGTQEESLINSLEQIKTKITNVVDEVTEKIEEVIENTISEYGDTGTRIAEAFTLQG